MLYRRRSEIQEALENWVSGNCCSLNTVRPIKVYWKDNESVPNGSPRTFVSLYYLKTHIRVKQRWEWRSSEAQWHPGEVVLGEYLYARQTRRKTQTKQINRWIFTAHVLHTSSSGKKQEGWENPAIKTSITWWPSGWFPLVNLVLFDGSEVVFSWGPHGRPAKPGWSHIYIFIPLNRHWNKQYQHIYIYI